jgi:tRNA uridine 5-carboxymethylaminomethyl modification enzyme
MFTSRAEFRMLLREDNAEERLSALAHASGLIDDARLERVRRRLALVDRCVADLQRGVELDLERAPAWIWHKARARSTYAGYLDRQRREVARIRGEAGELPLPHDLDYFSLPGLSRESAQRLTEVRPSDTSQAARIPGMTPAALACLWAHARRQSTAARPA